MRIIRPEPIRRSYLNPLAREMESRGLLAPAEYRDVRAFFDGHPTLTASPLIDLPGLATQAGIARLAVKDESVRFGLNAFKAVGAIYAMDRLRRAGRVSPSSGITCATSGNHGRAVAWAARTSGLRAKVFVPHGTVAARINAIEQEGAEVIVCEGTYEDAVRQAAAEAAHGWTVVSDTGWPGYEEVPRWIMSGYTRLVDEAMAEWGHDPRPDVVLVQAGVGGLACAVASSLAHRFGGARPYLITCEPVRTACLLESIRHGEMVHLEGSLETAMAGLQCAEISATIWPTIRSLVDACVAIDEERCASTIRLLARPRPGDPPIVSGASGVCGLAVLLAVLEEDDLHEVREASGLHTGSRVLVINTEGATDPAYYARAAAGGP